MPGEPSTGKCSIARSEVSFKALEKAKTTEERQWEELQALRDQNLR